MRSGCGEVPLFLAGQERAEWERIGIDINQGMFRFHVKRMRRGICGILSTFRDLERHDI